MLPKLFNMMELYDGVMMELYKKIVTIITIHDIILYCVIRGYYALTPYNEQNEMGLTHARLYIKEEK